MEITFKTIVGILFSGREDSANVPIMANLRVDPWERYQTESTSYGQWWGKNILGHDARYGHHDPVHLHL